MSESLPVRLNLESQAELELSNPDLPGLIAEVGLGAGEYLLERRMVTTETGEELWLMLPDKRVGLPLRKWIQSIQRWQEDAGITGLTKEEIDLYS